MTDEDDALMGKVARLEAENERLAHAWEAQRGEKVKESEEARLWFEKAQTWKAENERLRAAISWIEPPFVNEATTEAEIRQRISFCLADAERAAREASSA